MENANVNVDVGFVDFVESASTEQNNNEINPSVTTDSDKEDVTVQNGPESAEQNDNEIITLEDELREIFSKFSKNFNVVHINAQSISAHYLSLLATFVNLHNIDAVLVSETFLKDSMDTNVGDMPGFQLIRNDRKDKGCGGVAIYLRKELHYEIVDKSPNRYTMSAEHLFIEVIHEETKILLGVFYSPSSKIYYFSTFEDLLKKYRNNYEHYDILGDFNTDLLKRNSRRKKLLSIIDGQNLHLLPLGPTHFAPGFAPSILDLIIVTDFANVAKYGQLGSYFSYHDLIYVSNKLNFSRKRIPIEIVASGTKEEPFWQKPSVRRALAEQLKGLKIYKESDRGENDLKAYQKSREQIKQLETEFKRENRKNQKGQ
ncbi:PREDICTED: uncharacterized protein LOC106102548 [Papilio polytes]|uniref:uncharacterized protein LOC106102548 n=1 Tax=Papilio polytes TaxID=76194 RepID=UPI000675DE3C|nr:PREDICTED: uncharacterized protein LOC106102548 [Papilio polytes]XP_013137518.1 PREDICTED: uncharacterized protein LOC106102548 [Papilio polytes]XP_013137519.1 PREDICTED: uncharacterized protein LOC106102548 [Papilio polytes]